MMIQLRPQVAVKAPGQLPNPPTKMPKVTRETLAQRLRQNWLAKYPTDTPAGSNASLDDSLTSLNWLHNLNIMKIASPTPPASPQPGDSAPGCMMSPAMPTSGSLQVNPNAVLNVTSLPRGSALSRIGPEVPGYPATCRMTGGLLDMSGHHPMDKVDYKNSPHVKPPYSYATLICMAMKESKKNKVTLAGIYNWITENFMYYRVADPSWQNSIRHNLSLNKCFQKVPRSKDEPGKGGFWRINPEFEDMFVNGIFKKRRGSASAPAVAPPAPKRSKREEEDYQAALAISGGGVLPSASVLLTPATPSSMNGPLSPLKEVKIKTEPGLGDHLAQVGARAESALNGDSLDFSWNAILNQDIEVGGVRVKTEEMIDSKDFEATPITDLSPPPSEDSSSDIAFEELLNGDLQSSDGQDTSDGAVDLTTGQPLDLSITGTSLKPPEWWAESFNSSMFQSATGSSGDINPSAEQNPGLHTPIHAPSPVDYSHPWAESRSEDLDQAMASFDPDIASLFDVENIPSPGALHADS